MSAITTVTPRSNIASGYVVAGCATIMIVGSRRPPAPPTPPAFASAGRRESMFISPAVIVSRTRARSSREYSMVCSTASPSADGLIESLSPSANADWLSRCM